MLAAYVLVDELDASTVKLLSTKESCIGVLFASSDHVHRSLWDNVPANTCTNQEVISAHKPLHLQAAALHNASSAEGTQAVLTKDPPSAQFAAPFDSCTSTCSCSPQAAASGINLQR